MWFVPILFVIISTLCFISEYLRINRVVRIEYRDNEIAKLMLAYIIILAITAAVTFYVVIK